MIEEKVSKVWLRDVNVQMLGVEKYHGNTLKYMGVFVSHNILEGPEGLAFTCRYCYVGG